MEGIIHGTNTNSGLFSMNLFDKKNVVSIICG